MEEKVIKNFEELATTQERKIVLEIAEAGFHAIDTEKAIAKVVSLENDQLKIKEHSFNIKDYEHIYIVGFGKTSCTAASALEKVLGNLISQGLAIGIAPVACEFVHTYAGTHPLPSPQNAELSKKIVDLSDKLTEKDLVLVIVSGGGSALLCWPAEECDQANRLYTDFLHTGADIKELNTVRKHISQLKGGGLAKHLYPAKVVGLVFSDVPGNNYELVASGPTYKDTTTIADAQNILDKYGLTGYTLNETVKEDKYFEKVLNIPIVSNLEALAAMRAKALELKLQTKVISAEFYDEPAAATKILLDQAEPGFVVLAAGETKLHVAKEGGSGGRCQRLGMEVLPHLRPGDTFAAVASDGLDNSLAAGIVEDFATAEKMNEKAVNLQEYKDNWDCMGFYETLGNELLKTGPTGANVSDFMILYRK